MSGIKVRFSSSAFLQKKKERKEFCKNASMVCSKVDMKTGPTRLAASFVHTFEETMLVLQ